jgi:cold shock CspA family protein
VLLIVVCTLAFVGCRSLTGRSVGQQIDDKVVTTQVKTKLTLERANNLISTGVGTQFGVVKLTGTVHTPEQKAEAERIASRVAGVRGVQNDIVVMPTSRQTAKAAPAGAPAASPATSRPPALTGQVTAVNPTSGDVTIKTEAGEDVVLRVPAATAAQLEQGQKISISAGSVTK